MQDKDEQCTDKIHPVGEQDTGESRPKLLPNMAISPLPATSVGRLDMLGQPTSHARLHFPLLRQAPVRTQCWGMLCYSLLMAFSIMILGLSILNDPNAGSFITEDGSVNGQALLLTAVLIFLLMPGCSLLCGALFGSWRGMLVSLLSIGSGILMTHLSNNLLWNTQPIPSLLPLLGLPIAALVVGLIYERRRYAAWWKSLLTMMLGAAIVSIWLIFFSIIFTLHSARFTDAAATSSDPQAFTNGLWIGGTILAFLGIFALTFPVAGIEALIHWRVAAHKKS